ncbi:MAG: hypothetical protein QW597_02525 [Thermoplasmataceae archaeon]
MIEIKKGGKYLVISNSGDDAPMRTEGEFVGYTILGEEGVICFKVVNEQKKSLFRLIPVSSVIAIEFSDETLLTSKSKNDEKDKTNYIS